MALKLRPYQIDFINQIRKHMKAGVKRILGVAPTGSGKTAETANMIASAVSKNMDCLFVVHRRELVKQSMKAFYDADVLHGVVAAGFHAEPNHLAQICSVQSLARRLNKIPGSEPSSTLRSAPRDLIPRGFSGP